MKMKVGGFLAGTKQAKAYRWIGMQNEPYTQDDIQRNCNLSKSSASRVRYAYFRNHGGFFCWRPDGHGNFYRLYFPYHWPREVCQQHIDSECKTGQSRAEIVGAAGIPF